MVISADIFTFFRLPLSLFRSPI